MKAHSALPVLWHEGMLLVPQHFQHLHAHLLHRVEARVGSGHGVGGIFAIDLDQRALAHGHVSLRVVRGVFSDGTPFDVPEEAAPPAPLAVRPDDAGQIIALVVGRSGVTVDEPASGSRDDGRRARYRSRIETLHDEVTGGEPEQVSLGLLNLRLERTTDALGSDLSLPLMRVSAVLPGGQVTLDADFVPPLLDLRGSATLLGRLEAMLDLLSHRAEWQMGRLGQPQTSSLFEVSDFLLLQSLLRHETALRLELSLPRVEPLAILRILHLLVSDMAAVQHPPERAGAVNWLPNDPAAAFRPLFDRAEALLSRMRERLAVEFSFRPDADGLHVGTEVLPPLASDERIVLAVHAEVPDEWFFSRFKGQAIVGAADRLAERVRRQVPGVTMRHLPSAPPELPLQIGWHYFELQPGGAAWTDLASSRSLGLYVAGDWPGLMLRGWVIRAPLPEPTYGG
ncbi:type VI secretion system baseplate subunit TssK [Sphingomonas sp. NPDC079357]|uniref:type VI secretion system baseplate subunit TssK n=1 Tax=Sphingomonas sp. NPDC079357 TaxID=3364518 RepID=UPI003850CA85